MRIITNEKLKAAVLAYYERGMLTAQNGMNATLIDRGSGCRCAIGAAMTEAELAAADVTGVCFPSSLMEKEVVGFSDERFARRVQDLHDMKMLDELKRVVSE